MISIIICSKNIKIAERLRANIHHTIKSDHEIIIIDNRKSFLSIFEAYNLGIEKSKGDIICFIHEDVKIHTKGWGKILLKIFNLNPEIGLIGIAGSKFRTNMPAPWWETPEESKSINILQHLNDEYDKIVRWQYGFKKELEEVVYLDGVFMAMRKMHKIKFNEQLGGFHNYDTDISFQFRSQGLKLFVTNTILIEHYSLGSIDKNWYKSTLEFYEIYNKVGANLHLDSKISYEWEIRNGMRFVSGLFKNRLYWQGIKYWKKLIKVEKRMVTHLKLLKSIFFK